MDGRFLSASFALITLLTTTPAHAFNSVAQDSFEQGVQLLRRGRVDEALEQFQSALAADPSAEEAYAMWRETDEQIWLDMLVRGGQYELVAKRLMDLAHMGRLEHRNDTDEIKALLRDVREGEGMKRRAAIQTLSANHGEFAVPLMLSDLADAADDDRRINVIHALTIMDTTVVPPLLEALRSEDAFQRRNVAITLGRIGDPRAAGALSWLAQNDSDAGVKAAARDAADRVGSGGDPLASFQAAGVAYLDRRPSVLRPHDYSDVVWSWTGGGLESREVPRAIYHDVMAMRSFMNVLSVDGNSLAARAGIARAQADIAARFESAANAGHEIDGADEYQARAAVVMNGVGADALDAALSNCATAGHPSAGIQLARVLGELASSSSAGLIQAMRSNNGPLATEAACALGRIAVRTGTAASASTVDLMAAAAGREVVQIAAIIDPNQSRAARWAGALKADHIMVNAWHSGVRGLASLGRVPGVDLILLADELPDLTVQQVLVELGSDPRYGDVPVLMITDDAENASDLYGDHIAGTVDSTASDKSNVAAALEGGVDGDRAQANRLAAVASATLAELARAGHTDVGGAADQLARNLGMRPDEVAVPALNALAAAGSSRHLSTLTGILSDDDKSEPVRIAAANALAGVLGRNGGTGAGVAEAVQQVLSSGASLDLRQAAARALGQLGSADRGGILRAVLNN